MVREALSAVASPTVATRVLHRALHLAGEHEIPSGGSRLRRFVERHLRSGASFVLGEETAGMLVDQLAPLIAPLPSIGPAVATRAALELEASGILGDGPELEGPELEGDPHPMGTRRTDPAPALPTILVATLDPVALETIRAALTPDAHVIAVADVVALLDAVQQHRGESSLCVLIHGANASVQPMTLATIAADLPEGAALAFWGVAPESRREALMLVDATTSSFAIPGELDARHAADELRRMLGLPTSGIFAARTR